MDTNNWSPPPAGDTAVVTSDWRAQLPPDSRPRIVNKVMETLKRHLPFSGQEGLQELKKIAVRFEEKIYFAAESQQDYLRKISLKMLTMESKSQNTEPNPLQSNSLNNSNEPLIQSDCHTQGQSLPMQLPSNLQSHQQLFSQNTQNNTASAGVQASLDSTCQTGHSDGGDWQEEVYQKIKALKETYLPELNEMHQKIIAKFQQNESVPQPPMPEQVEKLKVFKTMLERVITFLQIPKHSIAPNFKEKLGFYEKQIINFINSNRRSKPPSQQLGGPGQILPTKMHSMQHSQSQITQIQSRENPISPHAQPMNLQGSAATMQQSSIANLQHSSESQQKMMHLPQLGSKLVSTGQGYALISMPWAPVGSLSQRPVLSPQQTSKNAFQNLVLKFILILLLVIVLFQLVSLLQTGESTYSMAQFPLVKWFVGCSAMSY